MIKTTILAYVIAFLGLVMIAAGIVGLRSSAPKYYGMAIAVGFSMEGIAQTLRILLDLVQRTH